MPTIKKKQKRRAYMPIKKAFTGRVQDNMKFYNSKAWRQKRLLKLQENPLCELCEEKGLIVAAEVVDHIQEINDGGLKLSFSNLQSLCHPCHNAKTGRRGAKTKNAKK